MPNITYVSADGDKTVVDINNGENLMHGALYNAIEGIIGECGGGLSCATCHVYIDEAWSDTVGGPATDIERELLESTSCEMQSTSRLGCQVEVNDKLEGLVVHLPASQY